MKKRICAGILLLCFFYVNAQKAEIQSLLKSANSSWYVDFDKTNQLVKKAEQIVNVQGANGCLSDLIRLYDLRIQSCNAFSRFQLWRQYINDLQGFLDNNKKELDSKEHQSFSLRNTLSLAQYFYAIGDNTKALELFAKLHVEYERLFQSAEVCRQLYLISTYIANIHQRNGEYEASINEYLVSINNLKCSGLFPDYALVYRNIGFVYFEKGDNKQAGKYLKLAEDSLQKSLRKSPARRARIALSLYESEASYYERIGKHDSAMLSMQKAIPLLTLKNVDDSFKGRINLGLGNLYLKEKKWGSAKSYFNQAERFFLNSPEDQPLHLSNVYLAKADFFEKLGETEEATQYCNKAFEKLVLNFKPDADGNPNLRGLLSKKQVFKVLQKKSQLLQRIFQREKNIKFLISGINTNKLSLALLDSTANEMSLDKDKVILAEESYSAFEDGIRMTYALYQHTHDKRYLDDCFTLADKCKGIVLLENLRMVNHFSGINPDWLDKEKEIKSELLLIEQDLYKLETENKSSAELVSLRERYATLKRDYGSLIKKIKIEAPDYYRLRFDHGIISPSELQSQYLQKGEAMIEYFVGDSTLAVVGLTNSKRHVEVKKIPLDFFETISRFRSSLIDARDIKEDTAFTKVSPTLYKILVKDMIDALGPDITLLTIIPDGVLGYLPFEVLRNPNTDQKKYMCDEYTIHYAYSATYLTEQMKRKTSQAKYFFAGFASSAAAEFNNQKLAALPGVEKEIKAITELLGSNFSIFNPATKDDFKKRASDFRILHMAMHSLVNEENSMFSVLVFTPSEGDSPNSHLLTALELYDMTLNSDLAVLSGCNSGFGTIRKGEGIMSFSRSFAYAGVPAAVISLWQVPDKATSKIMVSFYKYLKAGESKDRALQLAKQNLIRDYPQMSAPFYWAGFILTGNKEPLKFPSSWFLYWIIASLLIAELILMVAKRKMTFTR